MTKTDILITVVLLATGITFLIGKGFWSGFVSGTCFSIALLATLGKVLAAKAARQIDKKIEQRLRELDH